MPDGVDLFFRLKAIETAVGLVCGFGFLIVFLAFILYSFWKDIIYPLWVRDWIRKVKENIRNLRK